MTAPRNGTAETPGAESRLGAAPSPGAAQRRAERAAACLSRVTGLLEALGTARVARREEIARVNPRHLRSAVNLVDYAAVRAQDLRSLQNELAALGVSSLGRMEAGVHEHLVAVAQTLAAVAGQGAPELPDVPGFPTATSSPDAPWSSNAPSSHPAPERPDAERGGAPGAEGRSGQATLARNAAGLLGPAPQGRGTRTMVTMPSEAATDAGLARRLVAAGMDVARINCAHDGPEQWARMVEHLRAAAAEQDRDLRIAMDLAGPKVRTGPLQPGPRVARIKPQRDATGHVVRPARLWLGTPAPVDDGVACVPVEPAAWLAERQRGDRLHLRDARDSGRTLRVVQTHEGGVLVEFSKTVYFATGLALTSRDGSEAELGELAETEQRVRLRAGETLRLLNTSEPVPVTPEGPASIGCTLPEAFRDARVGHRVLLDDGKMGGVVRAVGPGTMDVEITRAAPGGSRLAAEKGINFPDTDLRIPSLTAQDREDLRFVARHADIVNMSFVRRAQDVADLLAELDALDAHGLDVTLKIETVGGFEQLPMMLLEAMRWEDCGVMIARGDLAVETGFERMAEVQEEILWLCEAAHVPVVWATQVLESLAKKGVPSRAEITDAAQGQRAECVMLNKGPVRGRGGPDPGLGAGADVRARLQEDGPAAGAPRVGRFRALSELRPAQCSGRCGIVDVMFSAGSAGQ